MRKWGAWAVRAALVLGLSGWTVSGLRADSADGASQAPPAGSSSLLSQWLGSTFKKSDSKPIATPQPAKSAESAKDSEKGASAKAEKAAVKDPLTERQHARDDYFRRLKVCDQLQMIADKMGDQNLAAEAQELSDRAGKIYEARIARLPVPPSTTVLAGTARKK